MKKIELFKQKQAEMTDKELHDLVRTELSKLCKTGGKSLTMRVPPTVTDTDMLISELLNRFKRLTVCPDCSDYGWIYSDDGTSRKTCPCHY